MTNQLVPSLRFKQFRDQWNEYKITDLSQYKINGGTPSTKIDKYWHGSIPWIRSSDLNDNDLLNAYPERYVNTETIKETSTKLIPNNSIAIVTRVGVGKLAYIKYNYSTSQDFLSLSNLRFNPYFLVYDLYLLINKEKQKLQGTSIKGITKDYLLSRKTFIPNQSEEQQIGDFFTKLDHMIELQTKKLAHLKKLKKGYLQKMFPQKDENMPRLRFNGFHDEWNGKKLKDISNIVGGGTPSTKNKEYWNGNINWYAPDEISKSDSIYTYQSKNKITNSGLKHSAAKIHPINTILFTSRAGIGSMAILKNPASTNQGFQSLELKSNISPYFIYSYQNIIKYKALKMAHGSTFLEISNKEMSNIGLVIPSIQEQNKIGQFFKYLDQSITKQKNKLTQFKQLKKGYLQKMFI